MTQPPLNSGNGNGCCATATIVKVKDSWRTAAPGSYPPISSIPQTSPERLSQATEDDSKDPNRPDSSTVLYLAYGSNLAAEAFLGVRGIRPLSQKNVSVPTLRLTFSLPGLPYREPCFANVDYRKLPKDPQLPDPTNPPSLPPFDPPHSQGSWNGGLVGVVYEVTQEDYRTIIRTEGGGASYLQIAVPCIPIPPKFAIPEKPPYPELPKPFFAKTLFAPYLPDGEIPDDPRKDKWWYKFVVGHRRPTPDYAQASLRYLNLLRDGAKEHDLPDAYQAYLQAMQPYTMTSFRQRVGQLLFLALWGPSFLLFFSLMTLLVDKDGNLPRWVAVFMTVMSNLVWMTYDGVFKPVFGDGERTQEEDDGFRRRGWRGHASADEEKVRLLQHHDITS